MVSEVWLWRVRKVGWGLLGRVGEKIVGGVGGLVCFELLFLHSCIVRPINFYRVRAPDPESGMNVAL